MYMYMYLYVHVYVGGHTTGTRKVQTILLGYYVSNYDSDSSFIE